MSRLTSNFNFFSIPSALPLVVGCHLLLSIWVVNGVSEPRVVDYKEIPTKFDQFQDKQGFRWQVNREGSITSGETQYLPSGMKLFLNGAAFRPHTAKLSDNSDRNTVDLVIDDKGGSLSTQRQFRFDLERGGIRIADSIRNSGKTTNVKVELKTAYQFPWQHLVGTGGSILSNTSKIDLKPDDEGVTVKFSVADGRQDTIILMHGDGAGTTPEVSASSNSRELVLTFNLSIPSGQTRSLVYWVIRRNIGNLEDISKISSGFYNRGELLNPGVSKETVKSVVNFPVRAFPDPSGPPPNVSQMVALNESITRIGVKRTTEDILWASPNNQLTGTIDNTASVELGGKSIPIAAIAAIEGGAGLGRIPRVYLRDGRVIAGEITLKNFGLKVGSEWKVDQFEIDEMKLLLLALGKDDGVAPAKTGSFVELRSGDVLAVTGLETPFPLVSVWGQKQVKLDEIEEFQYLSLPRPEYRLAHSDGSSLSALPTRAPLEFTLANGSMITVNPRSIRRIWKIGAAPAPPERFEPRWREISGVPKGLMPPKGFLLQGNNLYAGGFAEAGSFTVVDGNSALDVAPSQIVSMRALDPSLRSSLPQFEFVLTNGNVIKGGINRASLKIGTEAENWLVPVRHIIAFQSEGGDQ